MECPGDIGQTLERLIEHDQQRGKIPDWPDGESAFHDVLGADIEHHRRTDRDDRADEKRALHGRRVVLQAGFETAPGFRLKLTDFVILTSKCLDHSDRTQTLLGDAQDHAFFFSDLGGLITNPLCVNIDAEH